MTSQTKPRPYPRAVVRNVEGGHSIRLSHNPEYYFDVANVYPTYDLALADAAAWVRVERARGKTPTAVSGAVAPQSSAQPPAKVDGRTTRKRKPAPENCPTCGRAVRRTADKLADCPGTIPMGRADGTCLRCMRREKKVTKATVVTPAPKPVERPKPAPKPKPPAIAKKPTELIPIAPAPRLAVPASTADRCHNVQCTYQEPHRHGFACSHTCTDCPKAAPRTSPAPVTIQGSGPLTVPGPSDPVERDRAGLDAYLKRRGRDGGAETAVVRQGRGPAFPKAGL